MDGRPDEGKMALFGDTDAAGPESLVRIMAVPEDHQVSKHRKS